MTSWGNLVCSYFRALQDHLHIQQFIRKTHRAEHIPALPDNIYCSDIVRFYRQIKGKRRVRLGGIHAEVSDVFAFPGEVTESTLSPVVMVQW